MAKGRSSAGGKALVRLGLAGASLYALQHAGPVFDASGDFSILTAGAGLVFAAAATTLTADSFQALGRVATWIDVRTPRGNKGRAGWITSIRDLRHELIPRGQWGSYFGTLRGRAIFSGFQSTAAILGTTGSGKDISSVQTNILAIRDSKVVIDFKGDNACVLADALRKRGEIVRILNFGAVWQEILGPSDRMNPQHHIADHFWREDGLAFVIQDVDGLGLQLYPEPKESGAGGTDNKYFRDGSRTIIGFVIIVIVLVSGYEATLGDALNLLNDRESLIRHALWAAGRLEQEDGTLARLPLEDSPWAHIHDPEDIATFAEHLRGLASGIADLLLSEDSRTLDSFLTGAQQALAPFNATTHAAKIMRDSNFRFSELKEHGKTVTVFLVADSSRIESQRPILELAQYCLFQEIKRHPNKKKPVFFIGNEASNFRILNLASLLTWGRAYGLRLMLYIQSFAAFRITYGKETLNTLLSEQEILQVLPGQSDPETLQFLEKQLGQYSYLAHGYRGQGRGPFGLGGYDFREDAAPLMSADELRRCNKTLLFIRRNKPALVDMPSIAAIAPWRSQQAINPMHGKPYRLPVVLRLHFRGWSLGALGRWVARRTLALFRSGRTRS